jgi:hypothetical protein
MEFPLSILVGASIVIAGVAWAIPFAASYGLELLGIGRLVCDPYHRYRDLWKARALGCLGRANGSMALRVCSSHFRRVAVK